MIYLKMKPLLLTSVRSLTWIVAEVCCGFSRGFDGKSLPDLGFFPIFFYGFNSSKGNVYSIIVMNRLIEFNVWEIFLDDFWWKNKLNRSGTFARIFGNNRKLIILPLPFIISYYKYNKSDNGSNYTNEKPPINKKKKRKEKEIGKTTALDRIIMKSKYFSIKSWY